GQDHTGAGLDRGGNEFASILRHALQRGKQEAGLHLAAVGREAGDLDARSFWRRAFARDELAELHVGADSSTGRSAGSRPGFRVPRSASGGASAGAALITGWTSSSCAARAMRRPAIAAAVTDAVR